MGALESSRQVLTMASLWLVDTQRHQQARIHSLRPALDGLLFDSKMAVVAHPQVLDILPILVEVVLTPCPQPLWLGTIECPRLHAVDIVAISVQREACRTVKLVPSGDYIAARILRGEARASFGQTLSSIGQTLSHLHVRSSKLCHIPAKPPPQTLSLPNLIRRS